MMLEPPVERASAQAERLGRLAHVPAVPLECLADQHALDLLERQVLEPSGRAPAAEAEIGGTNQRAVGQEHGALQRMVQLAHVAGPRVALERMECLRLEPRERLAIPRSVAPEEVLGQGPDVALALTQRRQRDLDGVEPEQQ